LANRNQQGGAEKPADESGGQQLSGVAHRVGERVNPVSINLLA
jgi:hypothetical protein